MSRDQFFSRVADAQNDPDPRAEKYCEMAARLLPSYEFEVTFTLKPRSNDCSDHWGFILREPSGTYFKLEVSGLKPESGGDTKQRTLHLSADRPKGFGYSFRREEMTTRGKNIESEIESFMKGMIDRVFNVDPDEEEDYDYP